MRATLKKFQQYSLYLRYRRESGISERQMKFCMTFDEFVQEDIGEYFIGANGRVE